MPAAQFKAFWDATGSLWKTGALAGKPGGFFFSTASQGGGQETTAMTGGWGWIYNRRQNLQRSIDRLS
jgi:multimeric flavodoxin WrbA